MRARLRITPRNAWKVPFQTADTAERCHSLRALLTKIVDLHWEWLDLLKSHPVQGGLAAS